eukprot:gene1709-biopygen7336
MVRNVPIPLLTIFHAAHLATDAVGARSLPPMLTARPYVCMGTQSTAHQLQRKAPLRTGTTEHRASAQLPLIVPVHHQLPACALDGEPHVPPGLVEVDVLRAAGGLAGFVVALEPVRDVP